MFSLVFGGGGVSLNSLEANFSAHALVESQIQLQLISRTTVLLSSFSNKDRLLHLLDAFLTRTQAMTEGSRLRPLVNKWFYLAGFIPVFSISHIRHGLISLIGGQLLITPTPVLLF